MSLTIAEPEQTVAPVQENYKKAVARREVLSTPVVFHSREEAEAARQRVQEEDYSALERILQPVSL